jgi:hypothetical protein
VAKTVATGEYAAQWGEVAAHRTQINEEGTMFNEKN